MKVDTIDGISLDQAKHKFLQPKGLNVVVASGRKTEKSDIPWHAILNSTNENNFIAAVNSSSRLLKNKSLQQV